MVRRWLCDCAKRIMLITLPCAFQLVQVTSKRVANAKSERHYRNTGPLSRKKEPSFWQVGLSSPRMRRPVYYFSQVKNALGITLMSPNTLSFSTAGYAKTGVRPPNVGAVLHGYNHHFRCAAHCSLRASSQRIAFAVRNDQHILPHRIFLITISNILNHLHAFCRHRFLPDARSPHSKHVWRHH